MDFGFNICQSVKVYVQWTCQIRICSTNSALCFLKTPLHFQVKKFLKIWANSLRKKKKLDVLCLPLLVGPVLENIWLRVMAIYFVGADWYVFASHSFLLTLFLLVVSTENQGKTQFRLVDHDTGPTIRRGKEQIWKN